MASNTAKEPETRDDLYLGHIVKKELVVGPIVLQPPDMAYQFKDPTKTSNISQASAAAPVSIKQEPQYSRDWMVAIPHLDAVVKEELLKEAEVNDVVVKEEPIDTNLPDATELGCNELLTIGKLLRSRHVKIQEPINIRTRVKPKKANKTSFERKAGAKRGTKAKAASDGKNESKIEKQKKIYECDYCGKRFSFRPGITNHIRTHTGEKPYSCKLCSKKFADCAVYIRHRRMHAGEKPHGCHICQRNFSEKYLLKNHMLTHTKEFQYFCQYCPKKFVNSSNFRRHQRIHINKFMCDLCKKHFATKDILESHILDHKKPKPYVCEICDKGFGQSGHLNRHLAIHSGSRKPHNCVFCKKSFTQKESLKKHLRNRVCEKKR